MTTPKRSPRRHGTDAKLAGRRGAQLAKMTRWFTPAEVLQMATSANAELLAMSGQRNPYPGRLGVVEEGALADLLLVDGNPLQDLSLVATPDTCFSVIMKDGRIYKNGLAS
jgi:imidazolonepropionase-like amidohydrolase